MPSIRELHRALLARIVDGPGEATSAQRRAALDNTGLTEPLATLLRKVAQAASTVTDEDVARARQAGFSEDQLFELMTCAAVGQASQLYAAGLAALEQVEQAARDAS